MSLPELSDDTLRLLFEDGAAIWEEFRRVRGAHFHPFVPADYAGAYQVLRTLAPRAHSFLELGSGVGVITILADLLGFEAYGIELDPWLVEQAVDLASSHGSRAEFAAGSFVPQDFQDETSLQSVDFLTTTEGQPAYQDLGMELSDFDLVYMFPWPGEEDLHFEMMRRYGRADAFFLLYGGTDGFQLFQGGKPVRLDG
ncbi:MAG: class I SAM-dependent methyltransferase [Planctomycetota bacterium]|jgi:hypothetical protein